MWLSQSLKDRFYSGLKTFPLYNRLPDSGLWSIFSSCGSVVGIDEREYDISKVGDTFFSLNNMFVCFFSRLERWFSS